MTPLVLRCLCGGGLVVLFSLVAQPLKPKTFSGIFGAAPSVALASLALASAYQGRATVVAQAYAMMFGSVAMLVYALVLATIVRRFHLPAWFEAAIVWSVWLAVAAVLWALWLRR